MTALAAAKLVHVIVGVMLLVCVTARKKKVKQKAERGGNERLDPDQCECAWKRNAPCDQKGEHLIRGGEKDGDQRACRDHAACIQSCGGGGKSALRQNAEHSAHKRPDTACATDGMLHALPCAMLQKFH